MQTKTLYKCEAVILSTLNYKDYDQILTLFTLEEGLIKAILKGAWSKKEGKGSRTAPLTHAELVYTKSNSEIYLCRELSVLNLHLPLRKTLSALEAGCGFCKALLASQMLQKPSPTLFKLLLCYLEHLHKTSSPEVLAASFRMKILRHDGYFGLASQCSSCGENLASLHISEGECFCGLHAPRGALAFSPEEVRILSDLAHSRSLEHLLAMRLSPALHCKVDALFDSQFIPKLC